MEVVTKTVFRLWDIFGGTVNAKGYKVLDPHVKAIFGDLKEQSLAEIRNRLNDGDFGA